MAELKRQEQTLAAAADANPQDQKRWLALAEACAALRESAQALTVVYRWWWRWGRLRRTWASRLVRHRCWPRTGYSEQRTGGVRQCPASCSR